MNKNNYFTVKYLSALLFVLSSYSFNSQAVESEDASKESLANYSPVLSAEFKELLNTADVAAGEELFMRKCSSCHDNFKSDAHGKGPNLWNIFGRKAGTAEGFEYSDAMRQSGHTWDYATLNYYLTRTDRAVPGRIMNFRGIRKDAYRAKLLLFLRSMSDNPPALPEP